MKGSISLANKEDNSFHCNLKKEKTAKMSSFYKKLPGFPYNPPPRFSINILPIFILSAHLGSKLSPQVYSPLWVATHILVAW